MRGPSENLQCKNGQKGRAGGTTKLIEIKNPHGSFQTNPQANVWWVVLLIFLKKVFF